MGDFYSDWKLGFVAALGLMKRRNKNKLYTVYGIYFVCIKLFIDFSNNDTVNMHFYIVWNIKLQQN